MNLIEAFTNEQLKKEIPLIRVGDTVRVYNKIKEGNRERIQLFEGTVIGKHGGGISETFTVRRVSYGVGVEKTFPIHSPNVEKVEIVRVGKIRRAKLYYLRGRVGKASKVKEQIGFWGKTLERKTLEGERGLLKESPLSLQASLLPRELPHRTPP